MRSMRSTPRVPPGRLAYRLAAVVLLALVPVTALAGGAGRAEQTAKLNPKLLMLRLPDLAPGYVVGDVDCGLVLGGEGASQALTALAAHDPYIGCSVELSRMWTPAGASPGPPLVQSAAVVFDAPAGASSALQLAADVVAFLTGVERSSIVREDAATTIGDASAVYRTNDALVAGHPHRPGVAVVWRSGRVLALTFVGGVAPDAAEPEALRLAALQQARIASPTRLQPRDYDDNEATLDDPLLGIDVYWLGHRFAPGRGLPPIALQLADGPVGRDAGPGWRAELEYGASPTSPTHVTLGLWRLRAWARFARTRLGQLIWHERCARAERIALPGGRAVLYAGFATAQQHCDAQRAPDRFLAHVYLKHLVVSVNIPAGLCCRDWSGSYNSLAGMRRVVRALRRRVTARP